MTRDPLAGLESLTQPSGRGIFNSIATTITPFGEPRYATTIAHSGDLNQLRPSSPKEHSPAHRILLSGAGVALESTGALVPAVAEGLERYCTTIYHRQQFILATANELGDAALDLDTIPRCSEQELADPRCPLTRPSKSERLRWVKGVCLHTGKITLIPAVMVYVHFHPVAPAERLCMQITTGCAAQRSHIEAVLGGLLEVIERDAIALTWLQKLELPRVQLTTIPAVLAPSWDRYLQSSKHLNYLFFNATTDTGVPVIYGLQRSYTDAGLTTIVCCSAALDPMQAIIKVLRDMASVRWYVGQPRTLPEHIRDFTDLPHGASFMARAEQASAFNFLTETPRTVSLEQIAAIKASEPVEALTSTLGRLRALKMNAYAVDLTTDEALRAGMRVVRVLVPQLQPFAFHYRARYLGHKRLYDAPTRMGYSSLPETELNAFPQPFA